MTSEAYKKVLHSVFWGKNLDRLSLKAASSTFTLCAMSFIQPI